MAIITSDEKTKDKARTKAVLLSSIGDVVKNRLFSELSITSIVRRSGLSSNLVYRHFKNFDTLFMEYLRGKMEEVNSELDNTFMSSLQTFAARDKINVIFDFILKDPELQTILFCDFEVGNRYLNKSKKLKTELISNFFIKVDQLIPFPVDLRSIIKFSISNIRPDLQSI